jgi:FixJ family two-component response regulator
VSGLDLHEGLVRSGSPIPVVFITAYDDGPTRERGEGACRGVLTKPFDEGALIDALRRAIGRPRYGTLLTYGSLDVSQ